MKSPTLSIRIRFDSLWAVARSIAALGLAATCTTGAVAGEKFTPVSLADWTSIGGATVVATKGQGMVIPPGAQLYRVLKSDLVEVRLSTRPYFSSAPGDWASLELGPASLTFVRNPDGGGMVLLGDEALDLPFALVLDSDGRSQVPLEFTLSFDQLKNTASLAIKKARFDVKATYPVGAVEVALSAGGRLAWELEKFELNTSGSALVTIPAGGTGDDGSAQTTAPATAIGAKAAARKSALELARELFAQDKDAAAELAATSSNRNPVNSPEWHLESANALLQLAFSTARSAKTDRAVRIASRALMHTEKASRKASRQAGKSALAAAADETAALIHEKLLADSKGAKAFYLKAALRRPNGGSETELKRLEKIEKEAGLKAAARTR